VQPSHYSQGVELGWSALVGNTDCWFSPWNVDCVVVCVVNFFSEVVMSFTKLDSGIIFSSLMDEDDSVFKIFNIFLATCGADGISPISTSFLEKITRKDEIEIKRCVDILSSPDRKSRSTNDEGRRIRRVDGGFFVINYEKYRESSASDYLRNKQRKYRDKKDVSIQKDTVSIPSLLISSSELINSIELNKDSIVLIVDFLNTICETSYRANSEKTSKHINARLNEKFTVEDFKTVIMFKNNQWGEDEKMKEYLRPETLFGTKFESYLQAAKAAGYKTNEPEEEETGPLLSIVDQIKADAERNRSGMNDK